VPNIGSFNFLLSLAKSSVLIPPLGGGVIHSFDGDF
jgi:hypothetical protein